MYSEEYLEAVAKSDPLLAAQLRDGTRSKHKPVWPTNGLSETRNLTDEEARPLEVWSQGR